MVTPSWARRCRCIDDNVCLACVGIVFSFLATCCGSRVGEVSSLQS
ncbi:Uncharacterised protein [Vibrio cholerae]|nr:Uncharacterised protein [Vibrio cholerae]CSI02299.1 Uncharacterised protein [Vibrio cholerae]